MSAHDSSRSGPGTVRVVTDSTAVLPAEMAAAAALRIVPLTVTISGEDGLEGIEVTPDDVARALAERRHHVTTSRPAPAAFTASGAGSNRPNLEAKKMAMTARAASSELRMARPSLFLLRCLRAYIGSLAQPWRMRARPWRRAARSWRRRNDLVDTPARAHYWIQLFRCF